MRVIGGTARGNILIAPKGLNTRPTADRLRESLFNMLSPYVSGSIFLDLFSGSGAVGIEALSRGAEFSVFVDHSVKACDIIKKNLYKTKFVDKSLVLNTEAFNATNLLQKQNKKFDVIFLDPPYTFANLNDIFLDIESKSLLIADGIIVLEHSSNIKNNISCGFTIFKQKVYKTTTFSFFNQGGN